MARAYTLSNGSFLVGVDPRGHVRDVYYPHIGLSNHVNNKEHRLGVYADGEFSWLSDPEWDIQCSCSEESLAGTIVASHPQLGIILHMHDVVYNEKNIFLRNIEVTNNTDRSRDVKIFFAHEFRIWESGRGDTGYYDPRVHAMIHYEGKCALLMNALVDGRPFDQYTTGLFEIEGKEGSYKDAEDGMLSMNPIEHGTVDSVMRVSLGLPARRTQEVQYWLAAGRYIQDVHDLNQYVLDRGHKYLMGTSMDYWNAWVGRQGLAFEGLPEEVITLFNKSLLMVRAHVDDSGAIIASSDTSILNYGRDNYTYCWPRDGGYSALALTMAGDFQVSKRFFAFMNEAITQDGYLMHKYLPDGSVGSSWHPWVRGGELELPIQTDETAIVLFALREYYNMSRNLEFVESIYNSLIKRSADFLVAYTDETTGLPHPSYDLWEEKYGVHTYTCAATYGALEAAAFFADLLGKDAHKAVYRDTAARMKSAMLEHLYDEERGVFVKSIDIDHSGKVGDVDPVVDMSSTYGMYRFGVLPLDDIRVVSSMARIESDLMLKEGTIGGVPRYQEDGYYRVSKNAPPNPWIVTSLWRAQYYLMKAESEHDLDYVRDLLMWTAHRASESGVFSEQMHPHTGEHLGAAPLVWSHAEFVITIIEYLQKLEDLGICDTCYPLNRG